MAGKVYTTDTAEFSTRERCYIRELVNDAAITEFSLAVARVEPGVVTELHRLAVDEWYVITSGQGTLACRARQRGADSRRHRPENREYRH